MPGEAKLDASLRSNGRHGAGCGHTPAVANRLLPVHCGPQKNLAVPTRVQLSVPMPTTISTA